jgi:hypothetical protein
VRGEEEWKGGVERQRRMKNQNRRCNSLFGLSYRVVRLVNIL